jgi:hypothetical protein
MPFLLLTKFFMSNIWSQDQLTQLTTPDIRAQKTLSSSALQQSRCKAFSADTYFKIFKNMPTLAPLSYLSRNHSRLSAREQLITFTNDDYVTQGGAGVG